VVGKRTVSVLKRCRYLDLVQHNFDRTYANKLSFFVLEFFGIDLYVRNRSLSVQKAPGSDFSDIDGAGDEFASRFYGYARSVLGRELHDDGGHIIHERLVADENYRAHYFCCAARFASRVT